MGLSLAVDLDTLCEEAVALQFDLTRVAGFYRSVHGAARLRAVFDRHMSVRALLGLPEGADLDSIAEALAVRVADHQGKWTDYYKHFMGRVD